MPKKVVPEPKIEVIEASEPIVRISKKTGKPVRPMTQLQLDNLAKYRELGHQKRKELLEGVDLQKKAETIKQAKEELKKAKSDKQQEKLKNQKQMYKEAIEDIEKVVNEEKPIKQEVPDAPKKKKIKKKIIKYVSESDTSDSSDSDEEEIVVKKKKEKVKENKNKNYKLEKDINILQLKENLQNEQKNSIASLLTPSYF